MLLQNSQISGYFYDLNLELSTVADVFPTNDLGLISDLREQIYLIRTQIRESKLYVDPEDDKLRSTVLGFLQELENGRVPNKTDLQVAFAEKLGIHDAVTCRSEIEFLEERRFYGQEDNTDLLDGVIALTRYCRFLIFDVTTNMKPKKKKKIRMSSIIQVSAIPKEFCCPITLDLMSDPVIVSTGQTYDRSSITQWLDEGHRTCPNSGLMITDTDTFVSNQALLNLIHNWCAYHQADDYDPPSMENCRETPMKRAVCRAVWKANKLTSQLVVRELSVGPEELKGLAAHELRLLAKAGKESRTCIVEAGAIPLLQDLLFSSSETFTFDNEFAQANSVTAILNLSIHETNKIRIMETEGCLKSIVKVLNHGWSDEARENAAAALFSLSAVHAYKKLISEEEGAVDGLVGLLRDGRTRGKKDGVMALYNLSTHPDNIVKIIESGAASSLVEAVVNNTEGVCDEASGAVALLARQETAAEMMGRNEETVMGLVGLVRQGSPKTKENVLSALVAMCRSGGVEVTETVVNTPSLCGLVQTHILSGTKRSKRKALSLARIFQRHVAGGGGSPSALHLGGWAMYYALARNRAMAAEGQDGSNFDPNSTTSMYVPVLSL